MQDRSEQNPAQFTGTSFQISLTGKYHQRVGIGATLKSSNKNRLEKLVGNHLNMSFLHNTTSITVNIIPTSNEYLVRGHATFGLRRCITSTTSKIYLRFYLKAVKRNKIC